MALIIFGVILWSAAHLFARLMPAGREALSAKLGPASKGLFAALMLGGIILMVVGYRGADFVEVYAPPSWAPHLTSLLMMFAVILLGMGNSKGRAKAWFRHPMLMGFGLWTIAHLIANGDLASVYLFGGLLVWAVLEILIINKQEGPWARPEPGPAAGDIKLLIISAVVFVVIVSLHMWAGVSPFGG